MMSVWIDAGIIFAVVVLNALLGFIQEGKAEKALLNSRYLLDSSLSLNAHRGNKYLPLGIVAVVVLQWLFTYTAPFQAVFGNDAIPLRVWPWLFAGGLLFFLVVETEKVVIRLRRPVPRAWPPAPPAFSHRPSGM
jgi:magnesium-transporting ATPase (P-type)